MRFTPIIIPLLGVLSACAEEQSDKRFLELAAEKALFPGCKIEKVELIASGSDVEWIAREAFEVSVSEDCSSDWYAQLDSAEEFVCFEASCSNFDIRHRAGRQNAVFVRFEDSVGVYWRDFK